MSSGTFTPQDRALADAVVAARSGSTTTVADTHPQGWSRRVPGASAYFSGSQLSSLNSVSISDEAIVDADEVERMLEELAGTGMPYSLLTRGDITADLRPLVERHGLTLGTVLPLMVVGPEEFRPVALPSGVEVSTVSAADAEPHVAL